MSTDAVGSAQSPPAFRPNLPSCSCGSVRLADPTFRTPAENVTWMHDPSHDPRPSHSGVAPGTKAATIYAGARDFRACRIRLDNNSGYRNNIRFQNKPRQNLQVGHRTLVTAPRPHPRFGIRCPPAGESRSRPVCETFLFRFPHFIPSPPYPIGPVRPPASHRPILSNPHSLQRIAHACCRVLRRPHRRKDTNLQ